ncbi:hypothetical protein Glaag_0765 [Glaciecola sp. 4H-3-7+YE-5]|nr:hypothetical protein Glaag_0765 [Glaciecola sp. 4H-3-7+YE-5]
MNRSMLIGILLCTLSTVTSNKSYASLLVAGDTIDLSGTTALLQPELAGMVIQDDILFNTISPSGNDLFVVGIQVQNRVVRSSVDGSLIFAPRIISNLNNTLGNFLIDRAVINGFSDYILDVEYKTDGLGDKGPNRASRSAGGDQLTFDFLFPLVVSNLFGNPQEDSYFFSINSNASAFATTGTMSIFGRHLDHPGETFKLTYTGIAVPTEDVPEPALFSLLLLCITGLAFRQQRNRR